MASLADRFSSSQGRKDQGPNRHLAEEIVSTRDPLMLHQALQLLKEPVSTPLKNDVILMAARVSELAPELLIEHIDLLFEQLDARHNRRKWGAMIAMGNLAPLIPDRFESELEKILKAMDTGSVVTRDHGFVIMLDLYSRSPKKMIHLILDQIQLAPDNQLGQYTEKLMHKILPEHVEPLQRILDNRFPDLLKTSHQKRIAKLQLRLNNLRHGF